MATLTFLGTGNFLAEGRYWNSFVVDRTILVEPSPIALPHLRQQGIDVSTLDCVVISHFHPDHTFGWPFLALELLITHRDRPLWVVGPPGVEAFLHDMMQLGSITEIDRSAHDAVPITYVEVDGSWQEAGPLRFRGVEVDHVATLQCFGYLLDRGDRTVGYSGDLRPCPGLDELATHADVLVLECNGAHPSDAHMDVGSVAALRERFPTLPLVLTHMGRDVDADGIEGVTVPADLQTLSV